jgi:3-phosphoshikimate 1-carboxyvinyltransferase
LPSLKLSHPGQKIIGKIAVPGSKSEANRVLVLKQLYFPRLTIKGQSTSRDTQILGQALREYSFQNELNVQDAGTAMRFSLAFLATQKGTFTLRGTTRMHQRPIGILVDALRQLGAQIIYLEQEGYPPLRVKGGALRSAELEIDGSVSSQFISALMLIGPSLPQGLKLRLNGFSVSTPYIYLTANIMRRLGMQVTVLADEIMLPPFQPPGQLPQTFFIEPDWSAASYWYLIALLAPTAEVYLPGFRQYSLQGDSFVANLFAPLGVESHFIGAGFRLKKSQIRQKEFSVNLIHNPDLAQTMAVAFAALGVRATLTGLQTLRLKETNRLKALKTELEKTGAQITIGKDFLQVEKGIEKVAGLSFNTYDDHRMAMALAPLALLGPIEIDNPQVVEKSYGTFWEDLEKVGFRVDSLAR